MAVCKGCGTQINWIKTPGGKAMPVDTERKTIVTEDGKVINGYKPHWATCPAANSFKR